MVTLTNNYHQHAPHFWVIHTKIWLRPSTRWMLWMIALTPTTLRTMSDYISLQAARPTLCTISMLHDLSGWPWCHQPTLCTEWLYLNYNHWVGYALPRSLLSLKMTTSLLHIRCNTLFTVIIHTISDYIKVSPARCTLCTIDMLSSLSDFPWFHQRALCTEWLHLSYDQYAVSVCFFC